MLSRVAENTYWLCRQIERASNTSRLLESTSELIYDLSSIDGSQIWNGLLNTFKAEKTFDELYNSRSEQNIVRFLLNNTKNPHSILSCLRMARENARAIRENISRESWEAVNELFWVVDELKDSDLSRSQRAEVLDTIRQGCQLFSGIMSETLSRNHTYDFALIGLYVERADMVARFVRAQLESLIPLSAEDRASLSVTSWRACLESVGGYHMYVKTVEEPISHAGALNFILKDNHFPRSIFYCLETIQKVFERLPYNEQQMRKLDQAKKSIQSNSRTYEKQLEKNSHCLKKISELHDLISKHWFEV